MELAVPRGDRPHSATADVSRAVLRRYLEQIRFEVVPIRGVEEQVAHLPSGSKVTVTCSPTRGIEHTLRVAEALSQQGMTVVPHIAARLVADDAHLHDLWQQIEVLGFRDVFVIGGDSPKPVGRFSSAVELLRAMVEEGCDFEAIGVGAYPERHPLIDEAAIWQALREKQAYATYMVTQICFDAGVLLSWLNRVRQQEIRLPVYIGLPGTVDVQRLLRVSMKIGVGDSLRFASKHTNLAARLLRVSRYRPDGIIEQLLPALGNKYGIAGFHLNTFNAVDTSEQWRQRMLRQLEG